MTLSIQAKVAPNSFLLFILSFSPFHHVLPVLRFGREKKLHITPLTMKDPESGRSKQDAVDDSASQTVFLSSSSMDVFKADEPQLTTKKQGQRFFTPPRKQLLREMLAEMVGIGMIVFFGTGAVMSAIAREALGM
jgi:hypothetical protein